ncbi:hypothetical protein LXL04_001486 [Taraxacum kok-saghyz]
MLNTLTRTMGNWHIIGVVSISMAVILLHSCEAHNDPEDYVIMHSCIRKAYGLEPLCWDRKLAEVAQDWANQRKDCQMIHNNCSYGENMAMGPNLSGLWATQMWIDEKRDYDYDKNECLNGKMCGHYTQVVWANSKKIGCGRVQCDNGHSYIIVCNYDPPGNYVGEKPY